MRVNLIARRTINVDGKLDDWNGVLAATDRRGWRRRSELRGSDALPVPAVRIPAVRRRGRWLCGPRRRLFLLRREDRRRHDRRGHVSVRHARPDADFYPEVSYEPVDDRGRMVAPGEEAELREHRWPEGVRRFSYRRWPDIPSSMPQIARDNVLIAFNAIPMGQDGWESHLPGRMPKFVWYKTTDYEFALNKVADAIRRRHRDLADVAAGDDLQALLPATAKVRKRRPGGRQAGDPVRTGHADRRVCAAVERDSRMSRSFAMRASPSNSASA